MSKKYNNFIIAYGLCRKKQEKNETTEIANRFASVNS